jgi:SAM-dependent methyltransferase
MPNLRIFQRFGEYYDLIYQKLVDYEKDCTMLEDIFEKFSRKKPRSVLDVACGTGSHALILSRRGYSVAGIDISRVMINKAKKKAKEQRSKAEFHVQDMRNFKLNKKYDCTVCMFGGFGYILTGEDLARAFSSVRNHLVKNGLFAFEFWSVGGVRPTPYQRWDRFQGANLAVYRLAESNFDPQTNILNLDMNFIVVHEDKLAETFSELHKIRCYTLAEIREHLEGNGFDYVNAYDRDARDETELKAPRRETFRILVVAKKH